MLENLSKEQLTGILETIPVDITSADENNKVKFWNKHETRIFKRPQSALDGTVQQCHSPDSVEKVNMVIADLKSGRRDCVEYSVELNERTINVKNIAVRDNNGKYLGVMEVEQDITDIEQIKGEK